jgi:hypothetical protein
LNLFFTKFYEDLMLPLTLSPIPTIPSQLISYKEKISKNKKWVKETVDAIEALGRRQCMENLRFAENFQMVNGKFIWHHYIQDEGYKDWMTLLTKEFELPSTLRHYDIIEKVINNITEKLGEFPDIFRVEEKFEDDDTNEYVRTQTRLMHESVKATINREIKEQLIAQGVDPDKQDFASEDEAMQYQKEMQQMAQAMTPPQIKKYMATDWKSQGEIWGNHQLIADRETFAVPEMERLEMRDMLISSRCFRHFFLTGEGYMQETWNPLHTFFHTSQDIEWAQDGDYGGRMLFMTKSDIISRYGWKLKSKDVKKLEDNDDNSTNGKLDMSGFPYNTYAPFEDYKAYTQITNNSGYDPLNKVPVMNDNTLMALSGKMPFDRGAGLYRVTELYWMSQQKVGKAVYIDPDTDQPVKELVDENFVVPEGWKQKKGDFYKGDEINTVYWTYANQPWKCTKIAYTLNDTEAIYLDGEPCEFAVKGDYSPFGSKLPICGRVFNNRNAQAQALADKMKPHQVGHNVCMNQLYQLLEKEIGKFMVWDTAFFNTMKDWGGEDSWDKIALVAKELGHVFGDTSPQNMKGANPGNQLPKMIDMELTAQMLSRAKLAEFFENKAMAQLGISPQMMSDVAATETAEGTKTAVTQAQLNVQKYYTDFFEYKKRCLTMALDFAQYVQSKKQDVTITYTQSDQTREWVRLTGIELLTRQLHIHVVNSQELMDQMKMIKSLFLNNNTTDASALDLVEIITAYSPAAIKAKLAEVQQKKDQREDGAMTQQQQQIELAQKMAESKEQHADARNTENNQTKKEVAFIGTFNRQPNNLEDTNADQVPDVLEYNKLHQAQQVNAEKMDIARDSNAIKRDKLNRDSVIKDKELALKEKQLKERKLESKNKVRISKTSNKKPS